MSSPNPPTSAPEVEVIDDTHIHAMVYIWVLRI